MNDVVPVRSDRRSVWVADPFGRSPWQLTVPEGMTVGEIVGYALTAAAFPAELYDTVRVYIGEHEIARPYWANVRPKRGTNVSLIQVPLGGGSGRKIGMTIAAVAIAVLSYGTMSYVSGAMTAAGYSSAAASAGGMLAAAGVSMVGGVLMQLAFAPDSDKSSTRYSIDNVGNQPLEKNKPIPLLLGRRRVYPRIAATTWTDVHDIDAHGDSDVYLNMIVLWNPGPVALEDLKIGETPITEFNDVQVVHHLYPSGNARPTLYNQVVREDQISTELRRAYGWVQRRTRENTTKIEVTLSWPAGLYNKKGKSFAVNLQMQYKSVDSDTWLDAPTGGTFSIDKKKKQSFYKNYSWAVASGQYDVRIRRTNNDDWDLDEDDQGTQQTTVYWLRLHSYNGDASPMPHPELFSYTELRIRATNQINGTLDKLNAIVTTMVPKWNGSTFDANSVAASRNPAELFHWYATSDVTALPQTGAVDEAALGALAQQCEANKWYCDALIETGSMNEVLDTLAAAGQGFGAVWEDGLLSVAVDDEKPVPVQIFSARNVHNFQGQILYPDEIHAVNVVFDDETSGYQSQTRTVYAPGYTAETATLFETVDCPFKTNPREAYIYGWRYLAARILRPETYSFDTWTEGLIVRFGKRVDIAHWRMSVGSQGTRIREVLTGQNGSVTGVVLDDRVAMSAGLSYVLKIQSGSSVGLYTVATVAGRTDTLMLTDPVAAANFGGAGNHCVFGEASKETLPAVVTGIDVHADKTTTLTCIPYAPGMLANGGDIPAWNPQISSRQPGKEVGTRPLSPADQDAITDRYLSGIGATAAGAAGAADNAAAAVDGLLKDLLDTDDFATAEQIAAGLIDIDASNYEQVQRVAETLNVSVAAASARIDRAMTVAVGAQEAVAQAKLDLGARIDNTAAAVTQEAQSRAAADGALSVTINNLSAMVGQNVAAIAQEAQSRATADSALSVRIDTVAASIPSVSGLATAASVTSEAEARAQADGALADSLTEVNVSLGNIRADGYLRVWAVATDAGASSTLGLAASVTTGAAQSNAALILHAESNGTSYAAVRGGAFYVQNKNGDNVLAINSDGTLNVAKIISRGSLTNVADISYDWTNLSPYVGTMASVPDTTSSVALSSGTDYVLISDYTENQSLYGVGSVLSFSIMFFIHNTSSGAAFTMTLEGGYLSGGNTVWENINIVNSFFLGVISDKVTTAVLQGYAKPKYTQFRICARCSASALNIIKISGYRLTANF